MSRKSAVFPLSVMVYKILEKWLYDARKRVMDDQPNNCTSCKRTKGMTREEVFAKLQGVLAEVLNVDKEDVVLGAEIVDDLGAESIDFLDIAFRMEEAFGIKISWREMFGGGLLNNPDYVDRGRFTQAGIGAIKTHMPNADLSVLGNEFAVDRFSKIFTVQYLFDYVCAKPGVLG